jgi:uncharacterized protein
VDIGVHQDGLVHISELSDRYVKDPNDAVKVGQIVKVHVLNADPKMKRIGLSMKTQTSPGGQSANRQAKAAQPKEPKAPPPPVRMEDRIASLADRWKNR